MRSNTEKCKTLQVGHNNAHNYHNTTIQQTDEEKTALIVIKRHFLYKPWRLPEAI